MTTWRVYHVDEDRSLQYRCTVVACNQAAALLRARESASVDARKRLAVVEDHAYCEFKPGDIPSER